MFEITYIHHDCFLLRTDRCAVVFDFWKDPQSVQYGQEALPEFIRRLPVELPLYIFVSHFHKDHLNPDVFKWHIHRDAPVRYIISKDVERHVRYLLKKDSCYSGPRPEPDQVTVLNKGDVFSDPILRVNAFGSTDIGNSYAVTFLADGLTAFHAGDLNCWTWRDESEEDEIRAAEDAYESELTFISKEFSSFDVAMFPVDSRIGTGYFEGAMKFIRRFEVKRFFPMHFAMGETEAESVRLRSDALAFSRYALGRGEYIGLTSPYETYVCMDDKDSHKDAFGEKMEGDSVIPDVPIEFTESYFVSAGDTDAEQELSISLLITRLIEVATAHANAMHLGNADMPNAHTGWVFSRLAIEMERIPRVDTYFNITTWLESWNRRFTERVFCISDSQGHPLGYARSIWMVMDTKARANFPLTSLNFKPEYISDRVCPMERQARHKTILLPGEEASAKEGRAHIASVPPTQYTFRYSDLDAYRHVNTVKYMQLLANQYSLAEHDALHARRIELSFLHEVGYGTEVEILRYEAKDDEPGEHTSAFLIRKASDKSGVLYARITMVAR